MIIFIVILLFSLSITETTSVRKTEHVLYECIIHKSYSRHCLKWSSLTARNNIKIHDIPKAYFLLRHPEDPPSFRPSLALIDTAYFPLCCAQIICQIQIMHSSKSRLSLFFFAISFLWRHRQILQSDFTWHNPPTLLFEDHCKSSWLCGASKEENWRINSPVSVLRRQFQSFIVKMPVNLQHLHVDKYKASCTHQIISDADSILWMMAFDRFVNGISLHLHFTFIHLAECFYPKRLTIAIYVRVHMPLEQLGVQCLAQGHIGVSQCIWTRVSHTKCMCLNWSKAVRFRCGVGVGYTRS